MYVYVVCQCTGNLSCFKSNKAMYDCDDARVLLNIYSYLVFVGKGYLALVPSHLPHLRLLIWDFRIDVRDKDVEELVAAAPELTVMDTWGCTVGAMMNKLQERTYECCISSVGVNMRVPKRTHVDYSRLPL